MNRFRRNRLKRAFKKGWEIFLCDWWKHDWEFDGGKWVTKDVSITTRKCKREFCGLKQDIEHYHVIPNYTPGECGHGISMLGKERRPGDTDYEMKYDNTARPS